MHSRFDSYPTQTSHEQLKTETILSAHRPVDSLPKPTLQKTAHLQWLVRNFSQGLPERFTSQDASQPWLAFWTIESFYLLGAAMDPMNKQRSIDTIMACQHPDGGFGGGPGQAPHLIPTYAAVAALAIVGRPGPDGGWDQIDREKMYNFFLSVKQPDGSFRVSYDQEVDVRGIYCLLCTATMLNLFTPELVEGTAEFIASLQTYEGGFASDSYPYFSAQPPSLGSVQSTPRPPLGEAHGGYTFCALASWVMLRPFLDVEGVEHTGRKRPEINIGRLVRWLTFMQGGPQEVGGFRGRTNKLVDACYAWWVGGCFALIRALGIGIGPQPTHVEKPKADEGPGTDNGDKDDDWSDVEDEIYDKLAIQEYIVYAAQGPIGGLRDKPPKSVDSYHTLNALAGLSSAQHYVAQSHDLHEKLIHDWVPHNDNVALDDMRKIAYAEARSWREEPTKSKYLGGPGERLNASHPILNLTMTHVRQVMEHFYGQTSQ